MKYYLIAPLKLNLPPLEYESREIFHKNDIVKIAVKNKSLLGIVLSEVEKPNFKCKEAVRSELALSESQVILGHFVAKYYCTNIGVAFGIFTLGNSPLELHSADFGIFGASQTPSLVSAPKIPKNYESQTENPSVVDSTQSVESNKKNKSKKPIKSFCYFWLSPKVESPLPLPLNPPSNAQILTTHGFLNGKVITQIKGKNGFGYDPIFIPNGFESTLAEMPREAKNALSHRKIALDLMRLILCPLSAKNLS